MGISGMICRQIMSVILKALCEELFDEEIFKKNQSKETFQ